MAPGSHERRVIGEVILFGMGRLQIAFGVLTAVALVGSAQSFPPLDVDTPPQSRVLRGVSFCMTARKDIPQNSSLPLFTFNFAAPGASGTVLLDGKAIKTFKDERHLVVYENVLAGDHRFELRLDKAASNTAMSSHSEFKYCQP